MTPRRLFVLPLLLAAALAFSAACGDDDGEDDPRIPQIGGVSELATYAWVDAGTDGLFDYLSAEVTTNCNRAALAQSLADHDQPSDWQQIDDVEFFGEDQATATVILIYDSDRVEEEWGFVQEGESWRISHIPGLEPCEAAG